MSGLGGHDTLGYKVDEVNKLSLMTHDPKN